MQPTPPLTSKSYPRLELCLGSAVTLPANNAPGVVGKLAHSLRKQPLIVRINWAKHLENTHALIFIHRQEARETGDTKRTCWPLGIEPTTFVLPHPLFFFFFFCKPAAFGADWQHTSCGEPLGLVECYQRLWLSAGVVAGANASLLCIWPLLSGRMKLMRFQFGFTVNRGTICEQMTELREYGHICSWKWQRSIKTSRQHWDTNWFITFFQSERNFELFSFGPHPILSCARPSHCRMIKIPFQQSGDNKVLVHLRLDLEYFHHFLLLAGIQITLYFLHVHTCSLARAGAKPTCGPCWWAGVKDIWAPNCV